MGCSVVQTDTTTTVTGTTNLLPLPNIDMETMTDAFMTATVLAAVAKNPNDSDENVTRITGIANQRVKECDRIAAMITELSHLGVRASELPDGIQIHGIDRSKLLNTAPKGIKCYDDHRIAMSFSVLCCSYREHQPGPIITEKKCVEKTWPSWWDTLQNVLGMHQLGVDIHPAKSESLIANSNHLASIILIGMRGAGKTHMGKAAATLLEYQFLDMDQYFEQQVATSIPEYIASAGWEEFRSKESYLLVQALKEYPNKTVIACGGGAVEAEVNRTVLANWNGLVVHIKRDIAAIEEYLNIDKTRPMYGEDMRTVWKRREPLYDLCSNAEFVIINPEPTSDAVTHYRNVEYDFERFLRFKISGGSNLAVENLSFFVSLTCKNVTEFLPILDSISVGASALELRVDLLESIEKDFIATQIAILRRFSHLPIVYTVRSVEQGGRFPNNQPNLMLELIDLGFKLGCEYVDIEFSAPIERFKPLLLRKGTSKVIGSYHDIHGHASWDRNGPTAQKYKEFYPLSDIIKLIGKAKKFGDNFEIHNFANLIAPSLCDSQKPLIALLMGREGQLSRSLNSFFTPVTHPAVPTAAAPGQVSIKQIHQTRFNIGLLPKKNFVLFGKPISQSMSPTMHNTGFQELGLPHEYTLSETEDINEVKNALNAIEGASVTIPLKVDVISLCEVVSRSGKAIGAINTIYRENGKICGTNTDWIGIKNSIESQVGREFLLGSVGIVLGAGGTSRAALYALQQLGIKEIRIWNRTEQKAVFLANEFHVQSCSAIEDCFAGANEVVVIGTIPSIAQESLPLDAIFKNRKGVVVDMAYRPRNTKLLTAAKREGMAIVEGIEVLLEQGYEQFRIWTGIHAPRNVIKETVMAQYQ
jgi:pentafunctional AROM polypeptide